MRISTNQIYQRGVTNLLAQQEKASKLQQQIASGLKLNSPSDDPVAAAQVELMNQKVNSIQLFQKNNEAVKGALELEESVLNGVVNAIQSLQQLQIQGANGSMPDADRKTIALQAQNLLGQLKDYANSKDINGNYMFSGGQSGVPAVVQEGNQYIYKGDSTQRFQAVADNLQVAVNDTGENVFMNIPGGNGTFGITQPSTPNTGTAVANIGALVDRAAFVPGNYTMNFASTPGGMTVSVTNIDTATVVMPAALYEPGEAITFNGMQITVTGTPEDTDSFNITAGANESIYSTVQRMIANLNHSSTSPADRALLQTENDQLSAQLKSALNVVTNIRSDVGSRQVQLSHAEDSNSDYLLTSQATLKSLREIVPEQVIVDYNLQLVNLQAAQQSFVRIQSLSVFNYL